MADEKDLNKVIATITWTLEDLQKAFIEEYDREPTSQELDSFLDELNTKSIEERGIEEGWAVIKDCLSEKGIHIIKEAAKEQGKQQDAQWYKNTFYERFAKDFGTSVDSIISDYEQEVIEANPDLEPRNIVENVAERLINDNFDFHDFDSLLNGRAEIDNNTNSEILAAHWQIIDEIAEGYTSGITEFSQIQSIIDSKLRANKIYTELEEKGILTDLKEIEIADVKGKGPVIYSFAPFGYEGSLVNVECDLRKGIPAIDIVGISDGAVKEERERVLAACRNQGLQIPNGRILLSLSPADLKKEGAGYDLPLALSIMAEKDKAEGKNLPDEPVLAMGELELSGQVRPVRAVRAAVKTALESGIKKFIVSEKNLAEIQDIEGIEILAVNNLSEAVAGLQVNSYTKTDPSKDINLEHLKNEKEVLFNDHFVENCFKDNVVSFMNNGFSKALEAIETAVAGKHNLFLSGAPGCGKTIIVENLIPALTPLQTYKEMQSTSRIWSMAGLMSGKISPVTPFRMPHQTASVEGMVGGGPNCRPGEVELAHNGVLFLDELPEFRSSVLQFIKIPLKTSQITLSRAGRNTTFPADTQLVAAASPCACGNFGSTSKICLCSKKSVEQYNNKMIPVTEECGIQAIVESDPSDKKQWKLSEMQERIKTAFLIQRENGKYNKDLSPKELVEKVKCTDEMNKLLSKTFPDHKNDKKLFETLRISLTCANLEGRREVQLKDLKKALKLNKDVPAKILEHVNKQIKDRHKKNEMEREGR